MLLKQHSYFIKPICQISLFQICFQIYSALEKKLEKLYFHMWPDLVTIVIGSASDRDYIWWWQNGWVPQWGFAVQFYSPPAYYTFFLPATCILHESVCHGSVSVQFSDSSHINDECLLPSPGNCGTTPFISVICAII